MMPAHFDAGVLGLQLGVSDASSLAAKAWPD
jgi:hypothetical protein